MPFNNGKKNNCNVLLQHGWGFDRRCWQKMIRDNERYTFFLADRGYFGCPAIPYIPQEGFTIIICHSLGLHLLTRNYLDNANLLIILSGFYHFHGNAIADGRFSRKHIQRMIRNMDKAPYDVLQKFYKDCSFFSKPKYRQLNMEMLFNDLQLLDKSILDLERVNNFSRKIILHGANDRIVSLDRSQYLAERLNNVNLIQINDADHGLPFTHPEICWHYIDQAVDHLISKQ